MVVTLTPSMMQGAGILAMAFAAFFVITSDKEQYTWYAKDFAPKINTTKVDKKK